MNLPLLSADDRSRWTRLHDAGREHEGKLGYVDVREDLCRWLGLEREAAWQEWAKLSEDERTAFALCVAQERPMREVGRQMGVSASTVCRRVARVREALAACR